MGLRDLLKKKDGLSKSDATDAETMNRLNAPEFTFIRSDTTTQEIIYPPSLPQDKDNFLSAKEPRKTRHSLDVFRSGRSRSGSTSSQSEKKESRRLSHRLHLSRAPESSENVPDNLPEIITPADPQDKDHAESQWEERATMLASQNDLARSRPPTPQPPTEGVGKMSLQQQQQQQQQQQSPNQRQRSPSQSKAVSSKKIDEDIQEAIRLHEEGDLEKSTRIFGILADPTAANNPLSQVLYGLALRHGWGCNPDPAAAVRYLSAAASNAASIEQLALQAGLKKGGAAKGELVLAIFELANCFRHGWGIEKDAYAAKQYYETAANLGDSDAMNEVAWCYLEGFGCKKDKFAAARYYRLAEKAGNKTLGNSWIWKEKYDPPGEGSSKKK